jgi:hypothetical protein
MVFIIHYIQQRQIVRTEIGQLRIVLISALIMRKYEFNASPLLIEILLTQLAAYMNIDLAGSNSIISACMEAERERERERERESFIDLEHVEIS